MRGGGGMVPSTGLRNWYNFLKPRKERNGWWTPGCLVDKDGNTKANYHNQLLREKCTQRTKSQKRLSFPRRDVEVPRVSISIKHGRRGGRGNSALILILSWTCFLKKRSWQGENRRRSLFLTCFRPTNPCWFSLDACVHPRGRCV